MFRSVSDWWMGNTSARFNDGHVVGMQGSQNVVAKPPINLVQLLQTAIMREQHQAVTVQESEKFCAPHECVVVLSLFSRLALEPKFKLLSVNETNSLGTNALNGVIDALLGCICVGIWAEAREAAATLANLMWLPDLKEESLVCWLKFDGPSCITVDGANVLMPVKTGSPKQVDIGKGMYKSSWGIEFVDGSAVTLHPKGLKTHQVPGILTTASPGHTFKNTSQRHYQWFLEDRNLEDDSERWFSITCWFYWPLPKSESNHRVLINSTPSEDGKEPVNGVPLIYVVEDEKDGQSVFKWCLTGKDEAGEWKKPRALATPQLNGGWHMVSVLSSTISNNEHPFNGTKFYLDEWSCTVDGTWLANDFYMVGNGPTHRQPFGLITDFRIYARVLKEEDLKMQVRAKDTDLHPDRLARILASKDAATILAQRLDVPDSAAECLRALGSLATLSSQRAKIFSVCGRRVLQMIDSPLPMIQRQAARLINNIT